MLLIFDLDGVIYAGSEVLPHAAETVARLAARGDRVQYLTNNSAQTRPGYCAKLGTMGIDAAEADVMTSAYAAALRLEADARRGAKALVIGQEGLFHELRSVGMTIVPPSPDARADFVVVGIDRQFTYDKLKAAQQAIYHGARFIATNRDPIYPLEGGRVEPGSGSIVAAIETAAQRAPEVIGKPNAAVCRIMMEAAGIPPEQTVMIGDRLDTDIACGRAAGTRTVLVLTGTTGREATLGLPALQMPDVVLDNLSGLENALRVWRPA